MCQMDTKNDDERVRCWSAEGHLELLLSEEGSKPCDSISPEQQDIQLPPWFDEDKFKRGRKYYYDNSYGMFVGKLCGLLAVLAVPTILRILMFTQRSSIPFTAYKRYIATLLHTTLWYDIELTKDSRSWQSILQVRKRHFLSSQAACSRGFGNISQRDMALTQFGFLGFILVRPNLLGIQYSNREDREAFVHVWRCLGYIIGIEDRFNICRDTLEDTQGVCELILQRVFKPYLSVENIDFDKMSAALLEGMWSFNPFIIYSTFIYITKRLSGVDSCRFPVTRQIENNNENIEEEDYPKSSKRVVKQMHWYARAVLFFMIYLFEVLMQYRLVRAYLNAQIRLSLFLIKNFPFLAFYQFSGYNKCFIDIGVGNHRSKNS